MARKKKNDLKWLADLLLSHMSPEERLQMKANIAVKSDIPSDFTWTISGAEWAQTHPGGIGSGSDKYYASLAVKLAGKAATLNLQAGAPEGLLPTLGKTVAAYFEDVVSGFGVWDSFRRLNEVKNGRKLPFFDTDHDDYFDDEINLEDIKFLVWQSFCRCGQLDGRMFSPLSDAVTLISRICFDILSEEYETAPACTRISGFIKDVFKRGDFMENRELMKWLAVRNPMTAAPDALSTMAYWEDMITPNPEDDINGSIAYHKVCQMAFISTGPLGCMASVYLSSMAANKGYTQTAAKLDNVVTINDSFFEIVAQKGSKLVLNDKFGSEYKITLSGITDKKESFNGVCNILTSLVRFGDEWHVSGMFMGGMKNEETENNEEYISLNHMNDTIKELITSAVKRARGRRIFYCSDEAEMEKVVGAKPMAENSHSSVSGPLVLMLSDERGPLVFQNLAPCFKDRLNPYYNKRIAELDALSVLSQDIPDDMARYIVDKKLLPDACLYASQGKRVGKALVQDNMLFLFGFYRTKSPRID